MPNIKREVSKFKGGVWMGNISATWPFGILEVSSKQLRIAIEGLPFNNSNLEQKFTHDEIEKIEVKRYFPIITYGVHIIPYNKKIGSPLYFWYVSFRLKNLVDALIEYGWMAATKINQV